MNAKREGLSMPTRRGRRGSWRSSSRAGVMATLSVLAAVTVACSSTTTPTGSSSSSPAGTGTPSTSADNSEPAGSSPGVTATSVTVGQVDDLTVPLPGLFKGAEDGTKAYFAYVNSQGGVNGRKLVLDAQDSLFQGGQVATATGAQVRNDFALVGGFSLLDSSEKPLIDLAHMPDVGFPLDTDMASDPYVYSPLPNPESYYPLGFFKYLKQKFGSDIKKVGIIWENATASTKSAEQAVETAMRAVGFQIQYDRGV
ncbi:MAG TPA: ABC transporter substrate-binding protein, partial [Acidimicrobiales bacterium]|nr:ABC transporter substrate-binding protein [Acidimicrobiales bacterium]